jgi:hypothetical protein
LPPESFYKRQADSQGACRIVQFHEAVCRTHLALPCRPVRAHRVSDEF